MNRSWSPSSRGARPLIVTHHLNADLAGDLGLSCGGTVEILVEPLVPHPAYLAVLDAAASERGIVTTATAWPAGPDKTFAPLDTGDRLGAGAELSRDRTRVIERLVPPPRVLVFGAGHVGAAIGRAAHTAGSRCGRALRGRLTARHGGAAPRTSSRSR